MNPSRSSEIIQPFLASDVTALVLGLFGLAFALLWWRDREPATGWFALCWGLLGAWFAATRYQGLQGDAVNWTPWYIALVGSAMAFNLGLVTYLQVPAAQRRRAHALVWAPFGLNLIVSVGIFASDAQVPRSVASLPLGLWYLATGALAWVASRREPGAGHRLVAATQWAVPPLLIALALSGQNRVLIRQFLVLPFLVLALVLLTATLLRRRRALEAEVQRRGAAEAEVRSLNTALEARVLERTAQLRAANAELVTARDAALERHRGLLAAQQAEARYRALADWTPEAIVVHRDGGVLWANPAAAALLGAASAQDLVGKPVLQFVPPALHGFARERVVRMVQGLPGELLQMPFVRLDGTTVEAETISIVIQFDGQPALYQWARDISARRAAEQRAARLAGFYDALSRTGEALVRLRDETSLYDELCRLCVEAGQADRADLIGAEGDEAWLAAQCARTELFDQALYPTRFSLHERRWLLTSQAILAGEPVICADYGSEPRAQAAREHGYGVGYRSLAALPLHRGGRVCGALVLFAAEPAMFDEAIVDLLLRMTAEVSFALDKLDAERARAQALAEAQAGLDRFSRLFRSAPMAALISELADGTIVDINEAGCRIYGTRREAIVGRSLTSLGIGMSPQTRQALIERLRAEGRVSHVELEVTRSDREIRTFLGSLELIDWEGRQRLLSMGIDVTDLNAAQRAREQMLAAERSNLAKTEFISRMSHELRTPLNAVLGFAQLLDDPGESLTPRQRAHLHRLHDGASHLQALIDDVIDIASIEAGRLKLAPLPLEVDAVVDSAIALCTAAAEQARVEIAVDLPPRPTLRVHADPTRLRQVLANLLSNGIKYNRPGGRVVVSAGVSAGLAGDRVWLEIVDDGLGMAPEQLRRLFTPYDRLGRESSGVAGTGIGLVLSRQLVAMMGGQLTVHSQAGLGTRVEVELPRAADPDAESSGADTAPAAWPEGTGVVLYVEDEPVNRLLVEEALRTCEGVELLLADCGRDAVTEALARRPDLILLDMHLPDMDGPQVMSTLHLHAATEHTLVVALSASAMSDDFDRARAGGAVEYWRKPIDIRRLRSDVRRLLATAKRRT